MTARNKQFCLTFRDLFSKGKAGQSVAINSAPALTINAVSERPAMGSLRAIAPEFQSNSGGGAG